MTAVREGRLVLGCIADDFTGATDLGSTLCREGLSVIQAIGVPERDEGITDVDAVVVALKTRTAPVADAIRDSLAAFRWLRDAGAKRFYFKYCSTFDSRPDGNIGPVADALLDAIGAPATVVCPAFPETGRTVFQGHLFVGSQLLSESPMSRHPLTPMTDSSLLRLMGSQTARGVALVPLEIVASGHEAIAEAIRGARDAGAAYAVVDAVSDRDLREIAAASSELPLITGGSGLARGVPRVMRDCGFLEARPISRSFAAPDGPVAVLVGSASAATRRQVRAFLGAGPAFEIDPRVIAGEPGVLSDILHAASRSIGNRPILVHTPLEPVALESAQRELGVERSAQLVEDALADAALALVARGVRRIIVAGGETSAAVVRALGIRALEIGQDIAPGVPWCVTLDEPRLALALKSGTFGADTFFLDALRRVAA